MRRWLESGIALAPAIVCLATATASGEDRAAAYERVQAGLESFAKGDFAQALNAFNEAEKARPDDPRIAFDRGCALAASGDLDAAIEQFSKAAADRDRPLAVRSHLNLSAIAVGKALKSLGNDPDEIDSSARNAIRDSLSRATEHCREALRLQDNHEEARSQLESIRLWLDQMERRWQAVDRRKELENLDPFALLDRIEKMQRDLRTSTRKASASSSALTQKKLSNRQMQLIQDFEALEAKLQGLLSGSAGDAAPGNRADKAVANLGAMVREAMRKSAEILLASPKDALPRQQEAIRAITSLDFTIRGFPLTLRKAIDRQTGLVELSKRIAADESAGNDAIDRSDEQTWIAEASHFLGQQASAALKLMENDARKGNDADQRHEPAKSALSALKPAMEKATELTPAISELATAAADLILKSQINAAIPKQQQALQLLREIERQVRDSQQDSPSKKDQSDQKQQDREPNQQKQQDRDSQGSRDQRQENRDRNQLEDRKENTDERNPGAEKKDDQRDAPQRQDKKQRQADDSAAKEKREDAVPKAREEEAEPKEPSGKGVGAKSIDLTRMEIERLAERVRERDRKHRELKARLMKSVEGKTKVEKDW